MPRLALIRPVKWCFNPMTLEELDREYAPLREQASAVRSYL